MTRLAQQYYEGGCRESKAGKQSRNGFPARRRVVADGGAHGGALGASWFRPVGGSGQGGQTMVARGECDCQGGDNLAFPSNTLACSVLWPEAVARQGLWPGAGSDCQIAQEFFPLHSQDSGLARK